MNVKNCVNSPSFGSIYKFQIDNKNFEQANSIQDKLHEPEIQDGENYKIYIDFPSDSLETGIYEKIHISAKDQYDEYIESLLKQKNINFEKQTKEDVLNVENIFKRTVLPDEIKNATLVALDTKKVDDLFKEDKNFYISPNGESGTIEQRYQSFMDYLETGRNINATKLVLSEDNNKLNLSVQDGRHRFAVMRDLGMKKIKFALDSDSYKLALKYGLVAKD